MRILFILLYMHHFLLHMVCSEYGHLIHVSPYTYTSFWLKGKVRAPALCLRIIFSDYGSGAIGCNPDDLRDCESDRNG